MVKTYPIMFDDEMHRKLKETAAREGLSMKAFILAAIKEKIARSNRK